MTPDSSPQTGAKYSVRVTPEDLQTALVRAVATADPALVVPGAESLVDVCVPARAGLGDWSTRTALRAASAAEHRLALGQHLCTALRALPQIASADVAGPGFVNVTLTPAARARIAFDLVAGAESPPHAEAAVPESSTLTSARATGIEAIAAPGAEAARLGRSEVRPEAVSALQIGYAAACRERRRAEHAAITTDSAAAVCLDHPSEVRVLRALAVLSVVAEDAGSRGAVGPLLRGLLELAAATEDWLHQCAVTPPIDIDITAVHASRLVLVRAVMIVLSAGLRHMGASAPERI